MTPLEREVVIKDMLMRRGYCWRPDWTADTLLRQILEEDNILHLQKQISLVRGRKARRLKRRRLTTPTNHEDKKCVKRRSSMKS
ncbi:MAG: hypothetical protein GY820_34370 [Gammaproteobacteria bacterium]|nr:hypothetical protein [Gammaproteobacteria bacterium]